MGGSAHLAAGAVAAKTRIVLSEYLNNMMESILCYSEFSILLIKLFIYSRRNYRKNRNLLHPSSALSVIYWFYVLFEGY